MITSGYTLMLYCDCKECEKYTKYGSQPYIGANKYSERNWEKGLAWHRVYGATLRHLFAWWSGETYDKETGLNHLAHALCEIMFLLEFSYTHVEMDDRPKGEDGNDC